MPDTETTITAIDALVHTLPAPKEQLKLALEPFHLSVQGTIRRARRAGFVIVKDEDDLYRVADDVHSLLKWEHHHIAYLHTFAETTNGQFPDEKVTEAVALLAARLEELEEPIRRERRIALLERREEKARTERAQLVALR